ncbi:efflux RND transporter periplasmic adaptor subunit [Paraliomyxa miuraensis]|uniref:efflux RND transporter periplasmic adaptor subunit n=1 Tax=Paraliomyxa miuraensis TaxID=376150 RepID=UPI00224D11EA|nr:efflux RND transporter periplasmic adaptor subunit [Paraliomyxa miuraensis]MCX4242662.1 efflux RND transporter periplasmic adaptor subunit [Paraliomyxa miuraensis]
MTWTRPLLALLSLAALAAAPACTEAESRGASPAPASAAPPARVVVATARGGGLDDRWVFLGEVEAMRRAELAAGADGEVLEVAVRVGDRVKEGDGLLRVDGSLAKARLAAAKASRTETTQELEQARRDRERAESLGASIVPEAEIERDVTRATTLETRRARLSAAEREAKVQLGRHRVFAPFDGVIAARWVDPGDWVSPGSRVLDLVDDETVEIIVDGSAELVQRIEPGAEATVQRGDQQVPAEIVGVVRALDPITRTAKIRLIPRERVPWLLPGASVDVGFSIHRDEPGVVVPRDALVYGAVGVRVIEVQADAATPIEVEVIATADELALVRGEGLAEGDVVVVKGNERLRPGQPVAIVEPEPPR